MADERLLYKEIGKRIRLARERLGLTQAELGIAVDLSRTSITNIESGRQSLLVHSLVAISGVLDIRPSLLIPDEPSIVEADAGWSDLSPKEQEQVRPMITKLSPVK